MKSMKRFLKKACAVSLAVATAGSFLMTDRPVTASAAAPAVSLRTSFKTLRVGQKNVMTLKNNTIGWKITKVATNDRRIAMVFGRTAKSFQIKGKAVGRTTVKARLKTTSRKKHNSKIVKCRVNVIEPDTSQATEAVVSTQAELNAALENKNLAKLTIRTVQAEKFTIPAGNYKDVELTVDAPLSDVTNNGAFQSIQIHAIRSDTWFEYAVGNTLKVLAQTARIVVSESAKVGGIEFAKANAAVKRELNGTGDQISVKAKMRLSDTGTSKAPLNVTMEEAAEGSTFVSEAPVNISVYASVDITLKKGAEGSSVAIRSEKADPKITNQTSVSVTVTKADGSKTTVSSGGIPTRPNFGNSYGSGSNSGFGSSDTTTGGSITTTGGAIDTETENPGQPGIGGGGYPGSDTSVHMFSMKQLIEEMKPEIEAITITMGAYGASEGPKSVSMSAIVSYEIPGTLNKIVQELNPNMPDIHVQRYVQEADQEEGTWKDIPEKGWTFTRMIDPFEYRELEDNYAGFYEAFRLVDRYGYSIGGEIEVQIVAVNKGALDSTYISSTLLYNGIQTVTLAGLPFAEPSEDDSPGSVRIFAYQHWTLPEAASKLTQDKLEEYHIKEYTLKNGGQLQF